MDAIWNQLTTSELLKLSPNMLIASMAFALQLEDMNRKLVAQQNQIEEQKQFIHRLAVQLSTLRKRFNSERRKAGTNKTFDVNTKLGGVLREHTRILQDCVFFLRRQILELKRRDQMCQEHEKKVFNECHDMISKQISQLKRIEENINNGDYAQHERILKNCIQALTAHVTDLRQREELNHDHRQNGRSNTIDNEYHQILKSHITGMKRRKDSGDSNEVIFEDSIKLLDHRIELLQTKGVEIYGESNSKKLEVMLQNLSNNITDLTGETKYGVDPEVIFDSCIEMLNEEITELKKKGPSIFSNLENLSSASPNDYEKVTIEMELKEVEHLISILDTERKKQQDELSDHLKEEMEDIEGSESNAAKFGPSDEQNATNQNSVYNTHLVQASSSGSNLPVSESSKNIRSLTDQQNQSNAQVRRHNVLEHTSHIGADFDGNETQLIKEPKSGHHTQPSIQEDRTPTSRHVHFVEEHEDSPLSPGPFHTENHINHHRHMEGQGIVAK